MDVGDPLTNSSDLLSQTWSDSKLKAFMLLHSDIIPHILQHVAVDHLSTIASINRPLRAACQAEVLRRFEAIVSQFVKNVPEFCRVMLKTRSVISGSTVLLAIDPSNNFWASSVKDLDLYTCSAFGVFLVHYLVTWEGYRVIDTFHGNIVLNNGIPALIEPSVGVAEFGGASIRSVEVLVRPEDGKRIDVVVSTSRYGSTLPIFEFHSSIVMNFMNPYLIFCGFPRYTLKKVGLLSWFSAVRIGDYKVRGPVNVRAGVRKALAKYSERGYTLGFTPYLWDGLHRQTCPYDKDCCGFRTTNDRHCLIFPFGKYTRMDNSAKKAVSFHWDGMLPGGHVQWALGGKDCALFGRFAFYKPFSVLLYDY